MKSFTEYDFLCHHGILGMKWGVRRFQNKDGSLTAEGRERYKNTQTKKQYLEKYGIIKGAAKDTIKKGATINRLANSGETLDSHRKYVSLTEEDKHVYNDMSDAIGIDYTKPVSDYTYRAKKDISVMNAEKTLDYVAKKYGNKVLTDYYNAYLHDKKVNSVEDFLYEHCNGVDDIQTLFEKNLSEVTNYAKSKGYEAVADLMDYGVIAEYPVIILNPKETMKLVKEEQWTQYA